MGRCEWEAGPATMTSWAMELKTGGGKRSVGWSYFLSFPLAAGA